jgi:hypothetical protein
LWRRRNSTSVDLSPVEAALTYWEYAEYASVVFVIAGVAGEYIADFTNLFTRGDKDKKHRLSKASTLVLLGALAMELLCLMRTSQLSGRIIAELKQDTERDRLERVKLELLLSPRRLTNEQQARVAEKLKRFAGRSVSILVYANETMAERDEAIGFAKSIWEAFKRTDIQGEVAWSPQSWPIQGLFLAGGVTPPSNDFMFAIIEALKGEGIDMSPLLPPDFPPFVLYSIPETTPPPPRRPLDARIVVGKRPQLILNSK